MFRAAAHPILWFHAAPGKNLLRGTAVCLPCPGTQEGELAGLLGMKGGFQVWAGSGQLILTLTLLEQVASLRGPTTIWPWLLTKCPPNSRPGTLQVRLLGCEQLLMAVPGRSPMAVLAGSPSEGWLRTRSRQQRGGGELASE